MANFPQNRLCFFHSQDGPHTASESTVSNRELKELFGPHPVSGESSVSCFQPYLCAKVNPPNFRQNRLSFAQNLASLSCKEVLSKQYCAHVPKSLYVRSQGPSTEVKMENQENDIFGVKKYLFWGSLLEPFKWAFWP